MQLHSGKKLHSEETVSTYNTKWRNRKYVCNSAHNAHVIKHHLEHIGDLSEAAHGKINKDYLFYREQNSGKTSQHYVNVCRFFNMCRKKYAIHVFVFFFNSEFLDRSKRNVKKQIVLLFKN